MPSKPPVQQRLLGVKQVLSGADHNQLERQMWQLVKGLPLPRRQRLLWRNKLYLEWLEEFRKAQPEENAP